jgi:hypothetical protein
MWPSPVAPSTPLTMKIRLLMTTLPNGPLDENRTFHNNYTNQTPHHSFNILIKKLHTLHDEFSKRKKNENNLKIRNKSNSLRNLNTNSKEPEIRR